MFPIRDDLPHPRAPAATLAMIGVCSYAFWKELQLPPPLLEAFVEALGLIPARDWPVFGEFSPLAYLTTIFLHGGWIHLISNMWTLWIFGRGVEERMGARRFLVFYVVCGFAASVTHAALNPDSTAPVVGASGAIAGVMGAYFPLFPRARLKMFFLFVFYPVFFEIPAVIFLAIWFLGQLMNGAISLAGSDLGSQAQAVAFWAHIGGFLAGLGAWPLFVRTR